MAASGFMGRRARNIYYFDVIHDYPAIGGVVEFSRVLKAQLQRRYGERLVSAREALCRYDLADPGGAYLERERQIAQALAERDPGAIFFFPNFHSPIQRPASGPQPVIINVVHDVQFVYLPELFSSARLEWLYAAFAATCERADEIVFASRTTCDQFIARFGAPRCHRVIYHPVQGLEDESPAGSRRAEQAACMPRGGNDWRNGSVSMHETTPPSFSASPDICGSSSIAMSPSTAVSPLADTAPFLLTAAHSDFHPHKNMAGLLRLFAALAQRSPSLRLYVTGHGREKFMQVLQAALPQALHARVRHLGYVSRGELERLYAQAQAYVSLSRFEGFNMPAAEAASRGVPLILSDLAVHRELYGTQACLVDAQAPAVEAVEAFLRQAGRQGSEQRMAWPHRERCAARNVGIAYAALIDACGAPVLQRSRARPGEPGRNVWNNRTPQRSHLDARLDVRAVAVARAGAGGRGESQAVALSLHKLVRVLREVFAAGAVFTGVAAVALPMPAWADGGAGGAGVDFGDSAAGGPGGSGYTGQAGQQGHVGSSPDYYGGGGGGGGAGGGAGGAGGVGYFSAGGDGGTGGLNGNGYGAASVANVGGLYGEDGDDGSAPVSTIPPLPNFGSGGGGGGAGGYGAIVTGSSVNTNTGMIVGGNGGAGGAANGAGGGGGGDGGLGALFIAGGATLTNSDSASVIRGGAGGDGGTASINSSDNITVVAGAGGAGGAAVDGSSLAITNGGTITGGNGGAGGAASINYVGAAGSAMGGSGGTGGAGIVGANLTITNSGTITGGAGGNGGAGDNNGATPGAAGIGGIGVSSAGGGELHNTGVIFGGDGGFSNGAGGVGGTGVIFADGGTLNNSGTIVGGAGTIGFGGTDGVGGAGVVGSNLSIVNSGTITGQLSGSGDVRADAITFTGGTNILELDAGSSITGTVDATAGTNNKLILGGALIDPSNPPLFDVSQVGSSGQYRGFNTFEKTGTGTWELVGSTTALTSWILSEGTLSIGEDRALGDASDGVTFNGGTLQVTRGLATSRAMTLTGPGTIRANFSSSSPLELDGLISGPGSLTLTGDGDIVLTHANTYQGGTNVYADVDVSTTGALGTGPVAVLGAAAGGQEDPILTFKNGTSAGSLSIVNGNGGVTGFEDGATAGNATITNAANGATAFYGTASAGTASITNQGLGITLFAENASAGNATITNQSNGILLILDGATAEGAKVVNQAGGIVDISATTTGTSIGSLSGAGDVGLGGKVLTLGALNQNDTISGKIVDGTLLGSLLGGLTSSATGGSLVKVGTGTLTLNGANTYTGGTTVDGGTLAVGDADHPSASIQGDVQVDAAGTLRGHGSIAGNVSSTGMVWPGGSIGTLTIGGNYTQSPSGTLQVEVSPTAASQLKVGGTATLAGTLSLLYAPGTYTTKTYTLVSAGSVSGAFSTVKGNTPAGVTQSVMYSANTVDLGLTASVVAPTQATIFGAVGSSALRAGQGANEALLDRLAGPCGVAAASASSRAAAAEGLGSGAASTGASGAGTSSSAAQSLACPRQGNGLWIQAQGTDTRIDGNHGAPDARDRRYGFLTGVDHQWKGWTVGVAGGYSHADITESGNGSKGTLDTLRIAGYGAKNLGAYTLAGTLGYAYDFSSTTRSFGALGSAKGDGHGQEFTAGLQASRPWSLGPVVLTPRLGVRYAYLDGLGTDESGPTAQNLNVANQHLQSLQPYVGVTLDYPFALRNSDRPASVQLRAGYAYETQSTGRNVSVTAADGTGFVIAGTRETRGLVTAGLGATLPVGKSTSAYVRYDSVLHTGNVNAQSLQAGVDYRF